MSSRMACRDLERRETGSIWRGRREEQCSLSIEKKKLAIVVSVGSKEKEENMPQEDP